MNNSISLFVLLSLLFVFGARTQWACTYGVIPNSSPPTGDYHNATVDQSAEYGLGTNNCCTRIYEPSGVDPQQACNNDRQCKGFTYNGVNWFTLKNNATLQSLQGVTTYLKNPLYQSYANQQLVGDYHNAAIDQSAEYGLGTDNCCTRIYQPSGVAPMQACEIDPLCGGYSYNGVNWYTLKNSGTLQSQSGFTAYVKDPLYVSYANSAPVGDYHNAAIDQSAEYGLPANGCCTRIYQPSGVAPLQACESDPECQGYCYNGVNWYTLKNTTTLQSQPGFTAFVNVC